MSQYPYPQHFCQTPLVLDLYMFVVIAELKSVDEEFKHKAQKKTWQMKKG